jgi:hypothetical protein
MTTSLFNTELSLEERTFLQDSYQKHKRRFIKNTLFITSIAFFIAISSLFKFDMDTKQVYLNWFVFACVQIVLITIIAISALIAYYIKIYPIKKDYLCNYKLIEVVTITKKVHMKATNTFHFYVLSAFRLSFEIDQDLFDQYEVADELNLELSYYSHLFLGCY